jgi:hypothetical protein
VENLRKKIEEGELQQKLHMEQLASRRTSTEQVKKEDEKKIIEIQQTYNKQMDTLKIDFNQQLSNMNRTLQQLSVELEKYKKDEKNSKKKSKHCNIF